MPIPLKSYTAVVPSNGPSIFWMSLKSESESGGFVGLEVSESLDFVGVGVADVLAMNSRWDRVSVTTRAINTAPAMARRNLPVVITKRNPRRRDQGGLLGRRA